MTTVIWAIVPARSGSKGVPDKNIRLLGGHPLLGWAVRSGLRSSHISRVLVTTDSAAYADIAVSYGADAPFLRPSEFSGDVSSDLAFMEHAVEWLQSNEGRVADLFVHLRPTTPLRDPIQIDKAIETLLNSPSATALRSVHEMSESAYKSFEVANGVLRQIGTGSTALDAANAARQSFPRTYVANGYVDIVRTSLIREHRLLHGDRVAAFVTPPVTEVDAKEDLDFLEYQVGHRVDLVRQLFG